MKAFPVVVLAFATLVAGCGPTVSVPPLTPAEATTLQASTNLPGTGYRLEPGDLIEIRFPFHPEMDTETLVRPDGRINLGALGEVPVQGRTTGEVETALLERASRTLRDAQIRVTVLEFAEQFVYVTGEVGRPGLVPYRGELTPLQAISHAGGFLDTARLDSVVLVRSAGPGDRMISRRLDLQPAMTEGVDEPLSLAPHDVLYVPRTRIAEADIWVDQHVTRLFPFIRGAGARFPFPF